MNGGESEGNIKWKILGWLLALNIFFYLVVSPFVSDFAILSLLGAVVLFPFVLA